MAHTEGLDPQAIPVLERSTDTIMARRLDDENNRKATLAEISSITGDKSLERRKK